MKENFQRVAKISLVLVYLVIIAGAVVRMTGSGMGCPDWPKCFGHYIPPSDISELQWQPDHSYKEGQVIIVDKTLQVAQKDFKTAADFNKENWREYTKHKYAIFNPWHTWIEYINRLVTVILGIPMLLMTLMSFWWYKEDKIITIGTVLSLIVLGAQAVLGKIVVDTHLKPLMISAHMVLALVLMAMLLYLIHRAGKAQPFKFNNTIHRLLIVATLVTFGQIVLGIQVRQFIDLQIDVFGDDAKSAWLQNPSIAFYVHRSFSILVLLLNAFIAYRIYNLNLGYTKMKWVLLLLAASIFTGIAMNYFNFPFASQPMHLVLACLLLGVQFYMILEALKAKRSAKTL